MPIIPPPCPFDPDVPEAETLANFALLEGSDEDMYSYWRLAVATSQFISKLEHREQRGLGPRWFDVDDASRAVFCIECLSKIEQNPDLVRRWIDWGNRYKVIAERSPKWRLMDMISDISETHAGLSWPKRWERDVWEWAMNPDDAVACPFVDRRGVIDPGFRRRLRDTIEEVDGFLYLCEETSQVVFAPTERLERIWWHQDHLAAIDRNKPFGYFYDASRPNFEMRPPTQDEERKLAAIERHARRQKGWLASMRRAVSRLAR